MVVCICSNTTENDIKQYLEDGFTCKEIIKKTGACSDCKTCCSTIGELIKEHKNKIK